MSGGSLDYLYSKIACELNIPSGTYGIGRGKYGSYGDDVAECRMLNPMHDSELSEMMYDVTCLLHSLEWSESGDIGEEKYYDDVRKFKEKWFHRDSEQTREAYKADMIRYLRHVEETL